MERNLQLQVLHYWGLTNNNSAIGNIGLVKAKFKFFKKKENSPQDGRQMVEVKLKFL